MINSFTATPLLSEKSCRSGFIMNFPKVWFNPFLEKCDICNIWYFVCCILIMTSTLNKYFSKLRLMIFLKISNLSDRAKRSKMREFSDILSNHFFNINVRITQIMVFQFVSSPFAFKGSERKIDCSTKTKQIPPVIFLSEDRLLTPERPAKSQRRVFGVVNQPVKSSTYQSLGVSDCFRNKIRATHIR